MKTNAAATVRERTFEGAPASIPHPARQLDRQVATCMLFEDTFYASGATIASEIAATCRAVAPETIAAVAIRAREDFKLRHVPLFLLAQLDQRRKDAPPGLVARTVERVVQRADELAETLAIVQRVNDDRPLKRCLSAQMKRGLALAFRKFSAYALGKYNRDQAIKLRDVLFLVHAKPKDAEQAAAWKRLVDGTLEAPDTWEVALSSGADKRGTWERLLRDGKLGYMALLMNLRNMTEVGVDRGLVEQALLDGAAGSRALPFRFVSAAKAAPSYAQALSDAMLKAITREPLGGETALLVDVSGSMDAALSQKGTLLRWEAAAALAILLREVCERVRVFTFSNSLVEVPNLRGLAMLSGIWDSQPNLGTALAGALTALPRTGATPSRVIVITDEQADAGGVPSLVAGQRGYMVNVAPYRPGLQTSGRWTRINGFSERVVDFVRWSESEAA